MERLLAELAAEAPLREQEAALREALGGLTVELEETIGHIEEAIEVNCWLDFWYFESIVSEPYKSSPQ